MVKPLIHKLEQFEKLSDGEKRVLTDAIEDVAHTGFQGDGSAVLSRAPQGLGSRGMRT